MINMAFGVPCVRDFLAEHGHVLTVRGYDYKNEIATVRDLCGSQIKRKKVCEILIENDLAGFVSLSGFKTTADWWRQIKRFCKGRMYLYRVELYDELIDKLEKRYAEREHRKAHTPIDDVPGFSVDRNAYRDENDPTTIAEYNIYDGMTHSLDVRRGPALRDPALVDLQPFKDAAHADRLQRDAEAAERRHDRMRERAGEQQEPIKTVIKAQRRERIVVTGCKWNETRETESEHLERLRKQLKREDAEIKRIQEAIQTTHDINEKMNLIDELEEARTRKAGTEYIITDPDHITRYEERNIDTGVSNAEQALKALCGNSYAA